MSQKGQLRPNVAPGATGSKAPFPAVVLRPEAQGGLFVQNADLSAPLCPTGGQSIVRTMRKRAFPAIIFA